MRNSFGPKNKNIMCFMYDAEPGPGYSPLLAAVADHHPAGDFVAVLNFPHACSQLPHVSLDMTPTVI